MTSSAKASVALMNTNEKEILIRSLFYLIYVQKQLFPVQ